MEKTQRGSLLPPFVKTDVSRIARSRPAQRPMSSSFGGLSGGKTSSHGSKGSSPAGGGGASVIGSCCA